MYTVYQVTNNVNNKVYIGVHKTDNPNDSYMGSGRAIRNAINKHGKENFTKEVLFVFENKDDAYKKEQELVNSDFISTDKTYNGKLGGHGGWDHVRSPEVQALANSRLREFYQSEAGSVVKLILSEKLKGRKLRPGKWTNNETQKKAVSDYRKNSIWITDGINSKAIKKDEIIPDGWYKGRGKIRTAENPNISKNYVLSYDDVKIEIFNLKQWCIDNKLEYLVVFRFVDKGVVNPIRKFKNETSNWMIGKEIKSLIIN